MNADPRYFENTSLLNQISYREAIELAFYGATVIHPKHYNLYKEGNPFVCKIFYQSIIKRNKRLKVLH
jgi:aspartate kinase